LEPQLNLSMGVWPAEEGGCWLGLRAAAALPAGVEADAERLREEAWQGLK
jgi:hypothetical protein